MQRSEQRKEDALKNSLRLLCLCQMIFFLLQFFFNLATPKVFGTYCAGLPLKKKKFFTLKKVI